MASNSVQPGQVLTAAKVNSMMQEVQQRGALASLGQGSNIQSFDVGAGATAISSTPQYVAVGMFPVKLVKTSGAQGTSTAAATWKYDITDRLSGDSLLKDTDPTAAPHEFRRPSIGYMTEATAGMAYRNESDEVVVLWINEVAEQDVCP